MADYAKAVELDPNDADARTNLANARRQSGAFCGECLKESEQSSSLGKVSTFNGIGRMFYGNERSCTTCGSVIQSLWFTFIFLPILPLGSYRIMYGAFNRGVTSTTEKFNARRTPFCWKQVLVTWLAGLSVVAGSIAGLAYLVSRA